jgi:hypothetical protein
MTFWKREKEKKGKRNDGECKSFLEFLKAGRSEIERLIALDPDWFYHLPYQGAMSLEEARDLEIEKRAIWRRVIHDAQRTQLTGLRWETRNEGLVCPECRKMEGRVFSLEEYEELNRMVMHIGCRCNLVSVRD